MQHPVSFGQCVERDLPYINTTNIQRNKIASLPESYTVVLPAALQNTDPCVPKLPALNKRTLLSSTSDVTTELNWLDNVRVLNRKQDLDTEDVVSWAAYCAATSTIVKRPNTRIALLPLFHETAHSVAMIKLSMNVVFGAVQSLNSNQVLVMDQPLFAIAKRIQWNFPQVYGEDKFVVLFGGLHIEMTALKMIGDLLDGSGWTNAITTAGIATSGTADSFIKASHVTRSRHAHQITAAALSILQHNAY